jgi:Tfp pilus assembly protein PilO
MIHTRTKIFALISFGIFLAALVLYVGFFWVLSEQKETLYAERQRAAEAEVQSRALASLEATVARSQEDRALLATYVFRDDEVIDLLTLIEKTAISQNVSLTTESLTEKPIDDTFEELHVALTIKGSFDGIMRMIRILENIPEQSRVESVSISRAADVGEVEWAAQSTFVVTKYIES